jgi:phage shock protein E
MSNFFKGLFGKREDLKSICQNGAIIVDVRTPGEFRSGHIKEAINIPVDNITQRIGELQRKGKPVITCCRSGARSGMAKKILESAGLEVYNGGPWDTLEKQIR